MEQTGAETPLSNERQVDHVRTCNNDSLGCDTHFGQDPSESWYPGRWTGGSSFRGDCVIKDKPVCRDFLRGKCDRGTSCRFRHCESDSEDGYKSYVCYDFLRGCCNRVPCKFLHPESDTSNGCGSNGKENLDAVANCGKSQVCGEEKDNDSRIRFFSREPRIRSPCRKFLNGICYRGDSCPYLHSEYTAHDRCNSDRSAQLQQRAPTTSRNPSLGEGKIGNPRWMSRKHEEGHEDTDISTHCFYRGRRSRSPCRNFLRGRCYRGVYCPYLHLDTDVRPRDDFSIRQSQGLASTVGNHILGEESVHMLYRTSELNEETKQGHDRSTRSFSAASRSKSPCRNFLRGRCLRGACCPYSHLDTYVSPSDDCGTQQHQEVAATSENPGVGEGSEHITLRTSREHEVNEDEDLRSRYFPRGPSSTSPCRKFLIGRCYRGACCPYSHLEIDDSSRYSVDDIAGCEQNRVRTVEESIQLASEGDNLGVTSRSWSSERRRTRPLEDLGDKPRREVCLKYCRGRCTLGESCRYLHSFHEYAKSASDWTKQPRSESATAPGNSSETRQCEPSMICRELDRPFDVNSKRQYADNRENQNIPDGKDDLALVGGQKGEINGDVSGRNCEFSEADDNNINFKCRPVKRRSSRSGSPFTTRDGFDGRKMRRDESEINFHRRRHRSRSPLTARGDFGWRKIRRDESQDNFPQGIGYNVAAFRYPYSRSYRYNGPRYFMNKEPHSRVAASSVGPTSHEVDEDPNVMEIQGCDDTSHLMQLDQCAKGILEAAEDAVQPSDVHQKGGGLVRDCSELGISKGENTINSIIAEPDSTTLGENQSSPMSASNKDNNARVDTDLSQAGSDRTDGKKQALRTNTRKGTDLPTYGLPSGAAGETVLYQPFIVSVSRVSDDSDAQEVAMINHSVKEPEEGKVVKEILNSIESPQDTTEDGTKVTSVSGQSESNSMRMPRYSLKETISSLRRKLLVLDVNGLLADIVAIGDVPRGYKPDMVIAMKAVFKRPFCDDFLEFCFERFDVGVWSSRTKKNVDRVVDFLMFNTKQRLRFCWDQAHCTETGYKTIENRDKPLVLKELKKLWEKQEPGLPWDKGFYNETNTVLLDDSPYKALRNPPYTAIFPYAYKFRDAKDRSLGPDGDLRVYLERLAAADDVQKFIQENPFGQRPITKSNLSWGFYSKIAGGHLNQDGNFSCIPAMQVSEGSASQQEQTANNSSASKSVEDQANQQKGKANNVPATESAGDHAEQREGNADKIPTTQVVGTHSNQQGDADSIPVTESARVHANQREGIADKNPATEGFGAHGDQEGGDAKGTANRPPAIEDFGDDADRRDGDADNHPVPRSVASCANQQGSTDNTTVANVAANSDQQEGNANDAHATIGVEAHADQPNENDHNT